MNSTTYMFVAASLATRAKGALYRMSASRTGESPSWTGAGEAINAKDISVPITDKSFWEGRYVYCELTFQNEAGDKIVMSDAVVSLNRSKHIVTTQMVGMSGTVKEYINEGDYSINIVVGIVAVSDGVIVDEYPADGIRELRAFLDESAALYVHSEFLDIFDINQLVISSFSVTQDTASNYQSINISALSDEDYNIYSTDY